MLPEYRRRVGKGSRKALVARLERPVAKLHTLVKYLPEFFHILVGRQTYINKVYCHNALIETSVILRFAVFVHIRRQEAAAAHAGIAMTLAVLVDLVFEHNFFRNIIGNHTLSGAFCRQLREIPILTVLSDIIFFENIDELRERRGYPYTLFVFNAPVTLFERFFDYQRKVVLFLLVLCFVKVHKHGYKRSLSVCGHKGYDLILYHLNTVSYLVS